eukprot:XP_003248780.1 PREDICTED: uncharacterized protein LOC100570249 [Acyrthosiphon pisum]
MNNKKKRSGAINRSIKKKKANEDVQLSKQMKDWFSKGSVSDEKSLKESYPNIEIAIRIFLSKLITTASCERSFSKLKLIKTYLRSTMAQERLSSMAILSIETEIASKLDYEEVIDKFADTKARKISL